MEVLGGVVMHSSHTARKVVIPRANWWWKLKFGRILLEGSLAIGIKGLKNGR